MAAELNLTELSLGEGQPKTGAGPTDGERVQEMSMLTAELGDIITQNLADGLAGEREEVDVKLKNKLLIWSHLNSCYRIREAAPSPPEGSAARSPGAAASEILEPKNPISVVFDSGFEWITTDVAPDLANESTRSIVILEFFTHCCINCIHSIEDVRQVYNKIHARLQSSGSPSCRIKIISVHSPKFTREKDTDSIRAFVKRNRMTHTEVVNDPNCKLWNALNIYCWPTLLIFGPSLTRQPGATPKLNLIFTMVGEGHGHKDILENLLESSLEFFNSKIDFSQVLNLQLQSMPPQDVPDTSAAANEEKVDPNEIMLRFPGKVVLYNDHLVISDSGNNRLILCTRDGHVKEIIGGTESSCVDGDFTTARFYNPQGVAFQEDAVFYVADTGNHSVRKIDLKTKTVSTLIDRNAITTGDNNQELSLKSPWDVGFYGKEVLLIAAAGNHQIFCYAFEPVQLFSTTHTANSFGLVAGTGKEENRNNMYIRKAAFCQPSGICVSQVLNENDKVIYVADSESSTIRIISSSGRVMPFVGGAKDPTDLFAYGDADGCGYDVRLQHPVGVCSALGSSKVFIADTYNHKVKMIDCETKHCSTIIGNGTASHSCGEFTGYVTPRRRSKSPSPSQAGPPKQLALLNEPNGISVDQEENLLYIADTNNHCIKIANLKTRTVNELKLIYIDQSQSEISSSKTDSSANATATFDQTYSIKLSSNSSVFNVQFNIHGLPLNLEDGEWKLVRKNEKGFSKTGMLARTQGTDVGVALIEDLRLPEDSDVIVHVHIFLCGASACYRKTLKFHVLTVVDVETAEIMPHAHVFDYHPSADFFNEV